MLQRPKYQTDTSVDQMAASLLYVSPEWKRRDTTGFSGYGWRLPINWLLCSSRTQMVLPVFPVAIPKIRWWFVNHQGKRYFSQAQLRKVKKHYLKIIIPLGKPNHENPFLRLNAWRRDTTGKTGYGWRLRTKLFLCVNRTHMVLPVFPVAIPNFRWWFDRHKTTSTENCQSTE